MLRKQYTEISSNWGTHFLTKLWISSNQNTNKCNLYMNIKKMKETTQKWQST